jgi:type VI secretion system secreted protein Hcp
MIDAYLQIGDIKGESQDDKHKGWIEVQNVHWGVSQPRATAVSTAGGHTSGKADVHEVCFDKLVDIASPCLGALLMRKFIVVLKSIPVRMGKPSHLPVQ